MHILAFTLKKKCLFRGTHRVRVETRVVPDANATLLWRGRLPSGAMLELPGVHVAASTVHGNVEVVGVAGNVEAGSINGRVILLPAAG